MVSHLNMNFCIIAIERSEGELFRINSGNFSSEPNGAPEYKAILRPERSLKNSLSSEYHSSHMSSSIERSQSSFNLSVSFS